MHRLDLVFGNTMLALAFFIKSIGKSRRNEEMFHVLGMKNT